MRNESLVVELLNVSLKLISKNIDDEWSQLEKIVECFGSEKGIVYSTAKWKRLKSEVKAKVNKATANEKLLKDEKLKGLKNKFGKKPKCEV